MLSSQVANQESRSMMYMPHMSSPLSSSPLRFSPSPPSTPTTSSIARYTRRHDCIMSSPCKPLRQLSMAKTPHRHQSRSTHTTPISAGKSDSSIALSHGSSLKSRFSERQIKPNPLFFPIGCKSLRDDRETRRKLFLNHVKEASENKRWRGRNGGICEEDEQVMRALWLREERDWQEWCRREAQLKEILVDPEELTDEIQDDDYELAEVEALIQDEETNFPQDYLRRNTRQQNLGVMQTTEMMDEIEDDEYDHIFMEIIQRENNDLKQASEHYPCVRDHEMVDFS